VLAAKKKELVTLDVQMKALLDQMQELGEQGKASVARAGFVRATRRGRATRVRRPGGADGCVYACVHVCVCLFVRRSKSRRR
jgi:hypothetical protein